VLERNILDVSRLLVGEKTHEPRRCDNGGVVEIHRSALVGENQRYSTLSHINVILYSVQIGEAPCMKRMSTIKLVEICSEVQMRGVLRLFLIIWGTKCYYTSILIEFFLSSAFSCRLGVLNK